jgi:pimeloyl-ACP methyl ester carboxylesterase
MVPGNPTIIVPGLLGSTLENLYDLQPSPSWSQGQVINAAIAGPDSFSLALDRTGNFDASLQVVTRADGLLVSAYERLASALRSRQAGPVYVFPYDWRYSTAKTGAELAQFVARVRGKMAANFSGWNGKVDFVAHSLGGLVFRAFLATNPPPEQVGQVVFIAVPQRGCLEAAEAMIRGKGVLFGGRTEMRKLARTFPSLYELLPTFQGAAIAAGGGSVDFFDVRQWQENVTPDGPDGSEANGFDVEQSHLDAARKQIQTLRNPSDVVPVRDMLTLYATEPRSTLDRVNVRQQQGLERWYDFDNAKNAEGDGVVLPRSAILPRVPAIRITSQEASLITEFSARVVSLHAFIATLDETQTIVARFLAGRRSASELLPRNMPPDRYLESPAPEA